MKITCPNCNTSYSVDGATFPRDGRPVRCVKCRTVWHAIAYLPEPVLLPPEPREEPKTPAPVREAGPVESQRARIIDDGAEDAPEPTAIDVEQAAEARARLAAKHASRKPRIRYRGGGARRLKAFALGCVLAVAAAAVHYREDVVRALPSSAGLYALAGLPVNLRGLEFGKVTQRRDFEDGVPILIIEGEVVNLRDRATPMPALRFALRGKGGDELYAWTVEPRQRVVEPDTPMSFRTRLASPPRGANDLQVRFIERDRRIVGVGN